MVKRYIISPREHLKLRPFSFFAMQREISLIVTSQRTLVEALREAPERRMR